MDVVVAIPAHDEADAIAACLESVVTALLVARAAGVVDRTRIAVCAHRCEDATADRSRDVLEGSPVEWSVSSERAQLPVGVVRTRLIDHAVRLAPAFPPDCWVLSTDADTVVPTDWVTALLGTVRTTGADLVLGLAELDSWTADDLARQRYRAMLDAGIDEDQHHHAYAANLAVRWSVFDAVGGFPGTPHGEEHALAARVRASGGRVVSPLTPVVRTSARMPGRAAQGLGALLERLAVGDGAAARLQMGKADDGQAHDREHGAGQEDPALPEGTGGTERDDRAGDDGAEPPGVGVEAGGQSWSRDHLLEQRQPDAGDAGKAGSVQHL